MSDDAGAPRPEHKFSFGLVAERGMVPGAASATVDAGEMNHV